MKTVKIFKWFFWSLFFLFLTWGYLRHLQWETERIALMDSMYFSGEISQEEYNKWYEDEIVEPHLWGD